MMIASVCADGVGHVHDAGDEEREEYVALEVFFERADDARGEHRTHQADQQPREPVPEPAGHPFLAGRSRRGSRPEEPAEARHVLVVLFEEDGEQSGRRDQAEEPAGGVDNGEAGFVVAYRRPGRALLIRPGAHGRRSRSITSTTAVPGAAASSLSMVTNPTSMSSAQTATAAALTKRWPRIDSRTASTVSPGPATGTCVVACPPRRRACRSRAAPACHRPSDHPPITSAQTRSRPCRPL